MIRYPSLIPLSLVHHFRPKKVERGLCESPHPKKHYNSEQPRLHFAATAWWLLYLSLVPIIAQSAVPTSWVIGENYVATANSTQIVNTTEGIQPTSWMATPIDCTLWSTTPSGSLVQITKNHSANVASNGADAILSEMSLGHFYTRSPDQMDLEKRNSNGQIVERWQRAWVKAIQKLVITQDEAWGLSQSEKDLWLTRFDSDWKEAQKISVSRGADLWREARLFVDRDAQHFWVGFSVTTPSHMYSPAIRKYRQDGTLVLEHIGKDRGLFFDGCLESDRGLLFSRDLPSSSGFTLPVTSFLDLLSTQGELIPTYEADTNFFIESVACHSNHIYLLEKSVFSSGGTYLVDLKKSRFTPGNPKLPLPGTGKALLMCETK